MKTTNEKTQKNENRRTYDEDTNKETNRQRKGKAAPQGKTMKEATDPAKLDQL